MFSSLVLIPPNRGEGGSTGPVLVSQEPKLEIPSIYSSIGYIPLLRVKSKGASVRKLRPSIVTKQNIDLANLKNDSLTRIS